MEDNELMSIALNGLAPSWMPFVQGVCACESFPNFVKLWDNLVWKRLGWRLVHWNKRE